MVGVREARAGQVALARFAVACVAALGLSLCVGASAQASTWNVATLPDQGVRAGLYGISCATPSFCVAVGGNNTVASSTNPAGGAAAWRIVRPGGGFDVPFDAQASSDTFGGGQIRGVSCPSINLCVAASFEGDVYSSTDPTGPAPAWKVIPLTAENEPNIHMGGVDCPIPSFCVAVGYGGKVVTTSNPTGDRTAWTVTQLDAPYDLRGVSCASVSLCVAVGNEGAVLTSTNPAGGPGAWSFAGRPAGEVSLNDAACPTAELCLTGNASSLVLSQSPGSAAGWRYAAAGTGLPVKGLSCASPTACAAVDNNADVIVSTDPADPTSWWFKNVVPYTAPEAMNNGVIQSNGTFAISCPATTLCVAVGMEFKVLSSIDPFVRDAPKAVKRGNSKRPRVLITKHPAKRTDAKKGGNRVRFRFRAIGEAVGFRCKLHGKRFRPCKSPALYRVGRGKHAFKVRAIAPGGLKGQPSTFHFRVGKLTERPPVGSCPDGSAGSSNQPCVRA